LAWDASTPLGERLCRPRLPALDGLRLFAVLLVLLAHAHVGGVPADLGVSVFFVLSGFLITWLLMKERDETGTVALGPFYLRRAFRLLPAYYAYLAVGLALHFRRPGARTDIILPSLLYYANYFNATHHHPTTPIAHTWSLAVEEQFYLFWPFAFRLFSRVSRRAVARFLVVAILAVMTWRSYLFLGHVVDEAWIYNAFDCRFDNLAVGCLLAVLSEDAWFLRAARAVASHPVLPLLPIGALTALHWQYVARYRDTVGFTVDALLIGLAIVQIVQLADRLPWRWLDHRVPRYLGTISYPIYLWHGVAMSPAKWVGAAPLPVRLGVYLVTAAALGAASYHGIEKPFLRLRARLDRRRREAPSPAPA
jgi:peptidoglycan/LPS O-acetylase OafA/YrhL